MNRRYLDVLLCSVLVVASILILTSDGFAQGGVETRLGSLFVPRLVAGFILIFALMIGIPSLRHIRADTPLTANEVIGTDGLGGVAVYVAIFVAYWWALPAVGFLVATPPAMFAIAVLLGGRSWLPMLVISTLTPTLIFYGARELIRVYLPEWAL